MAIDKLVSRFIRVSLIYFALGTALGVFLVFWPEWPAVVRSVHVHVMLLGWLSMAVYAGGYAIVPRLSGRRLYSTQLAYVQFWLANIALIAMSVFWVIVAFEEAGTLEFAFFYSLFAVSAVLAGVSGLLFVFGMTMTLRQ